MLLSAFMLGASVVAAQPAQAALPVCDASDISPTSPGFTTFGSFDCSGFVGGNAFNSGVGVPILQGLLDDLFGVNAYNASTISYTKLSGLSGATSADFTASPFNTTLNGMTLIGFHYGAGNGSPGFGAGPLNNGGKPTNIDSSALYYFDAGTNLETLYWKYGASSDIVLFSTGTPPIPEPATWAMMILGMGAIGATMRRRKVSTKVSFA
tara:strand:+ start:37236 stop:37862 length:627 start_codon:yes stop_codon:yes gene_type:complete